MSERSISKSRLPWWVIALLAVAGVGFVALSALGLWVYANHDRLELIDRRDVVVAVESACAELDREVGVLQTERTKDAGRGHAERIEAENEAVRRMVARIRSLGREVLEDDRPALMWLDDWASLVEIRHDYAATLRAGDVTPRPAVPTEEGYSITGRMEDVGLECTIPAGILDDVRIVGGSP